MIANAAASDISFMVVINDHYIMRGETPAYFELVPFENNTNHHKGSMAKKMSELLSEKLNMTFTTEPAFSFANKKVGDDEVLSEHFIYTLVLYTEALRKIEGYTFRPCA